tara:strand:+ start:461 stop:1123 length:663 start_codon:yes stop_codon:yes gene_type:complete
MKKLGLFLKILEKKLMNKILFFISVFFILSYNSYSKDYKYQQFLNDNALIPVIKSNSDNAVDIIEFSSFSCSHCATFHNETLAELKESEVFNNVNYYVVDFPLNQAAFYASIVASCDLSVRPNYIDSVYENYDVWTKAETPEDIINLLNSYGLQHGLDEDQLDTCLKDEELQNKLLSLQVDSQNIFGVESTPTFIVGGEKVQGNRPASEFIKIISKKLNQ